MTLQNPAAESKPKRAQLDYALIDVDFFSKPKIKAVKVKFKLPAALWLIEMILDLSRATDAEIEEDVALAMAEGLTVEKPQELLKFCLEQGILDRAESGRITQRRVLIDQEKMAMARAKALERQHRSREGNATVTRDKDVTEGEKTRDPVTDTDTDIDLKKKGERIAIKNLNTPEVAAALERWERYSRERLKKPFDEITRESVLMGYAGRANQLIRDIDGCIASNWRVLRDCSDLEAKPQANKYHASAAQTVPLSQSKVRGAEVYKPPPEIPRVPTDPETQRKIDALTRKTVATLPEVKV